MKQLFLESDVPGEPGWVNGSPVGIPPSGSLTGGGCKFDLGPEWAEYHTLVIRLFLPAGGSTNCTIQPSGSDTPAYDATRRLNYVANSTSAAGINVPVTSAVSSQSFRCYPNGRYVACLLANVDAVNPTVLGTKVTIQAFPGIEI